MKRSFVFLNLKSDKVPAALIVFDKVVSSNPDFKKYWLLHSIEEPVVKGTCFTVKRTQNGDSGMLQNEVLLPSAENLKIERSAARVRNSGYLVRIIPMLLCLIVQMLLMSGVNGE